ncbi:hypothetical protein COV88_00155 [Candidatus Saccharibacteria bacterium CG11_big_fil_rev_8_21_14_0_20_41_19]|nr:hypothetical protein [Candidatus Saccharibacteria bacterium]OIP85416.1 MAG: hypothetical protein AUK57_03825 [Candidatus Saccharibacteria bacterium CG2_30_41_52]PIQ71195.1 MAG: hypothetical protein COV88_00155 [Candidatus Saccharibacteria bacterium CG11_big_fil_rev_8_21_14_0_20_41_19]PJC29957.1 MAG: hypothetical protein CO052_00540 [Candidatus Saccharibacteria bacterium CG_4_9_14_0_2_um_filter_41_9]PJE66417.1 MAG: hypothetical protein COU92_00275 [Candidatus Saccharibacteria bacterium CG10_b
MSKRLIWWVRMSVILTYFIVCGATTVYAETLQSNNYKFDESVVGAGGLVDSSSSSYQGSSSTGDLVVGNTASGGYQIDTGSKTTPDPTLSFAINNSDVDFPDFTPTGTSVKSMTFSVLNYTSYGYAVQIFGNPPTNGAHTITPMLATDTSQIGQEQFGINLVANTLPSSIGANPDNGQFGFGAVETNYNTPNSYRYVAGETIASAPKSSGITVYTISYIVNVASITPGGKYTSDQTIIITGTY